MIIVWYNTDYFCTEHCSSIVSELILVKNDLIVKVDSLLSFELRIVNSIICFSDLYQRLQISDMIVTCFGLTHLPL